MHKLFFLIFLSVYQINTTSLYVAKHWLNSCAHNDCSKAINSCLNCNGEFDCISCVTNFRQECSQCAQEIFNVDDLESINGINYLLCDKSDPFQDKICHIYCRGISRLTGQCTRVQNIPVCQCSQEIL